MQSHSINVRSLIPNFKTDQCLYLFVGNLSLNIFFVTIIVKNEELQQQQKSDNVWICSKSEKNL